MRILFLTKYTQAGASSRYRSFQYLPCLEQAGINYVVAPLFDDAYLAGLYRNGRYSGWNVMQAFLRSF